MAGGNEAINAALDELDWEMVEWWEQYKEALLGYWEGFSGNNGQMTIVADHIIELVYQHLSDSHDDWPMIPGPEDLAFQIYSCFDPEVIDRAFSDTIDAMVDELSEYWDYAMEAEEHHDEIISAISGSNYGPHANTPPWS